MKKKLKKIYVGFIIGTIASIFTSLFTTYFFQDLFNKFESFTYDMRYKWKYDPTSAASNADTLANWQPIEDVVIADIDERAMQKYGVYHKWQRSFHGDLVKRLAKDGAALTGFDIIFSNADFGAGQSVEIEKTLSSLGIPLTAQSKAKIRQDVNYDQMFCDGVKKAGNVIGAILLTDSRDYQFNKDWQGKSTEEWRKSINPQSAARLPDSIRKAFQTAKKTSNGQFILSDKDALDGIFPELAKASSRVGYVNVAPDPDGVHRAIPLFFNFLGYTYPALSLQMAMKLAGTSLSEIEIKPGEYIDLGKPFKIWKDSTSSLCASFPGITGAMVEEIIKQREKILTLREGGSLQISSYLQLRKDENGKVSMEVVSGVMPQEVLADLWQLSQEDFNKIPMEEPAQIGATTGIKRYKDGTFDIIALDSKGEESDSWEGIGNLVFGLLKKTPLTKVQSLKRDESLLLSTDLTIRRVDGAYTSQCPYLRKKAIDDLLALKPADLADLKPGIKLGMGEDIKIPIDEFGNHIITYRGPTHKSVRYISYYDIKEGRVAPHSFQHKSVIVGSSATALFDIVSSPFSSEYPAVEIHATLLADFLDNTFMRKLDAKREWAILIALGIFMGVIAYLFKPMWAGLIGFLLIMGHFLFAMTMFDGHLWIQIIRPIITILLSFVAVVAYQYVTEEKDKRFLHETFKQYLTPALIDQMYESKQMPSLGGEEGIRTAYFTDIQGFSTFSEKLGSPTKLVELLNEYLSAMTDILLGKQGTLDKYEGDAIIAFFGAPMPLPDHATRACSTSLMMLKKLGELRAKWASEGDKWPKIVHEMRMRIGINSGPIVTGNMGSSVRMNYTMMGDSVNLAARLESGSKAYGSFATCSVDTLKMTDGSIIARELDILRVVGKAEPVAIHEILCFKNEMDEKIQKLVEVFGKGIAAYRDTKWDDAIAIFEEALKYEPNYKQPGVKTCPSIVMKDRCIEYKTTPPVPAGQKWDGVYTATSK